MNIANWLHSTALKTPEAPALYDGKRFVADYRRFAERASSIGAALSRVYGVQAGDRVALFCKNRVEYLEILYGVWWVGAAAVPVNAKLHPKEAAWIVDNADATVLFTDDGGLGRQTGLNANRREIAVDGPGFTSLTQAKDVAGPRLLRPGALAWLFYTSGTTGQPKGVMLSHDNLIAMSTAYVVDVDDVGRKDAILYAAPMSHGAGLYNFIHVRCGARHVVPSSRGFDPLEIFDLADDIGSLSLFAAPTMVNRMVAAARAVGKCGNGVKSIIYGGAPMYLADIERALEAFGPKFVQIYGQGESPMAITSLQRELISAKDHPQWRERVSSVGTAQSCVEVRVVDDEMRDLPPGEAGEIVVRGPTVMEGYWRNETATREALVDGWLKTGDIGRFDRQGFLTLTDRSKDLIISGGANIYPREVEEVLLRCAGVQEVSVIGEACAEWGERVVAFVVLEDGAACDAPLLDAWCRKEMAAFKRPKRYIFSGSLPKNAYGKILKKELRLSLVDAEDSEEKR